MIGKMILWGMFGGAVFWLVFECVAKIQEEHAIEHSRRWMLRRTRERMEREQGVRLLEGEQQKESHLYQLDLLLVQSGVTRMFPWMTTEMFLGMEVVLTIISVCTLMLLSMSLILAIVVSSIIPVASGLILYICGGRAYQKLEQEIIPFMNLLENYSKTNDDIVKMMQLAYPFVEEPLRGWVQDFCQEAGTDGDTARAFRNLSRSVSHPRLRELLRNLELCSLHEANYAQIIKENRESIQDYLGMKEERAAIRKNGRVEIVLLLVASGICLTMFGNLVRDMKGVLLGTLTGNCLLGYCTFVIGYALFTMLSFDRR